MNPDTAWIEVQVDGKKRPRVVLARKLHASLPGTDQQETAGK